jgi:hypothetical protein
MVDKKVAKKKSFDFSKLKVGETYSLVVRQSPGGDPDDYEFNEEIELVDGGPLYEFTHHSFDDDVTIRVFSFEIESVDGEEVNEL